MRLNHVYNDPNIYFDKFDEFCYLQRISLFKDVFYEYLQKRYGELLTCWSTYEFYLAQWNEFNKIYE